MKFYDKILFSKRNGLWKWHMQQRHLLSPVNVSDQRPQQMVKTIWHLQCYLVNKCSFSLILLLLIIITCSWRNCIWYSCLRKTENHYFTKCSFIGCSISCWSFSQAWQTIYSWVLSFILVTTSSCPLGSYWAGWSWQCVELLQNHWLIPTLTKRGVGKTRSHIPKIE